MLFRSQQPHSRATLAEGKWRTGVQCIEVNETLHADAPPEGVPLDVWQVAVGLVKTAIASQDKSGVAPQTSVRATLQVLELVRIPYTKIDYRFENQDYVFYVYDGDIHRRFSQGVSKRCGELPHAPVGDDRSLPEELGDGVRLPASRQVAEPYRDFCSVHCSGEVSRIKVIDARKEVSIGEYNR